MLTTDERREVAARLREHEKTVRRVGYACVLKNCTHEEECDSFGMEGCEGCFNKSLKRLADLIEPEPERTCHAEMDWDAMEDGVPCCRIWRCSCGETFPYYRGRNPSFCPECGDKVVE